MNDLYERYRECRLCPRRCGVDRTAGAAGYCRAGDTPRLASAVLHRGEEPPLVTGSGSGALFFSGCTLRCASCQNCAISREGVGIDVSVTTLSDIMLVCQAAGASNINVVTGSHFAPSIIDAVTRAREAGLTVPLVWNTSGYESIETLETLSPVVDVWLTDLKTLDTGTARDLMNAPDYPAAATATARWTADRTPLGYEGDALVSGVVCRQLVLPGRLDDTEAVLAWYARHLEGRAVLSVMMQYLPIGARRPAIDRSLSHPEYEAVLALIETCEIEDGFVQEYTEDTEWVPDFGRLNPFPETHADPIWHWRGGFVGDHRR